ncbi:hypothetical protein BDV29DRAFT_2914 [Aspergillus leporis]|jgi:hypothetical protein|uniref:Uncharacterized protein n=1 Tax=Aspergillus leporis TaxID=41062 RepID=A0A5N5XCQ3_9EURO|nr:hypothetical protein BDV29DRAFT_2914 [Aspergillus leporis]
MARKRPILAETQSDQPRKKGRHLSEDSSTISEQKDVPAIPSSPISPKDISDSTVHAETPSGSPKLNSGTKSPYTAEFFADMADTIAKLFPFEAFARTHDCSIGEVSQAISAMIVSPLSDPSFAWHSDDSICIAEYGQHMIEIWNEHYERKLNNADTPANQPAVNDISIPTASQSSSDSEIDSNDESDSSASFDQGYPDATPFQDEVDTSDSELFVDCLKEEPQLPKKSCLSTQSQRAHARPAKRVRWAPPLSPVTREHVYKDGFGNYVPVPTEGEVQEMERRKRRKETRHRSKADQGLFDEPELTFNAVDWLSEFDGLSYLV